MSHQITKVLPRSAWERVIINENNESLVEVPEAGELKHGLVVKEYKPLFLVRKTVAQKLVQVSENLPLGINLVFIEGYRTLNNQQESWDRTFLKLKADNPHWTDEEIEKTTRQVVAKPQPLANHHCGGAVDVTLAHAGGILLDMGSPYPAGAYGIEIQKKFPMFPNSWFSRVITKEQEGNRKILREAMKNVGFVWYPGEWWHYCYGDRMWAVYTKRTECFYGSI